MIVQEILTRQSKPNKELDLVLADLCEMIVSNQDSIRSMVGAAVVDPNGKKVLELGELVSEEPEVWRHAERTAIESYNKQYGDLPKGSIIVTTLSPCSDERMELCYEESCTDLLEGLGIKYVYCGYMDPSQDNSTHSFELVETGLEKLNELCEKIGQAVLARDEEHLKENFADGKVKGKSRPGRVKRAGASCAGSVTSLRSKAKKASGERANMKAGKNKNESTLDEKWSQKYKSSINCAHPKGFSQRAHCQGRKKK